MIRYPHGHETIVKMLDRNGKKEQIRDAFTQVLGQGVGIAFECDAGISKESPAAAVAERPPATLPRTTSNAVDGKKRITPERRAELRADPLICAIMDELGGDPLYEEG